MTKPVSVKVGPFDYAVSYEDAEWENGSHQFGQCYPDYLTIRIASRLTGHRLAAVFLHEIAHALAYQYGCYQKADAEKAADLASYGMLGFWRDNPDAFDWWIALVKDTGND